MTALIGAVLVTSGVSLGAAAAASATTWTVEPCQNGSFTVVDGDIVRFVYGPGDACSGTVGGSIRISDEDIDGLNCEVWLVTPTTDFEINGPGTSLSITVAGTATLGNAVKVPWCLPEGSGQLPTSVMQAVPVPTSGDCADVSEAGLDFAADIAGGWSKSWQEWANAGTGGAVCVRTLLHAGDDAAWTTA
jgi:hypothetical protein